MAASPLPALLPLGALAGYWLAAAAVMGYCQGRLLPTLRAVPLGSAEARRNSRALHRGLTLAYLLPAFPLAWWPGPWWLPLVLAGLLRLAVFDAALNLGAGSPWLYVGYTAGYDRLLRRLSPARPEVLAGVARLGAAALAAGTVFCAIKYW